MRPATTQFRPLLAATVVALGFAGSAWSEELAVPANAAPEGAAQAPAPVNPPARGITMNRVEAQFGAPTERHNAIGNPPITRWDYPGFSVFFEHQHVIHSVIR